MSVNSNKRVSETGEKPKKRVKNTKLNGSNELNKEDEPKKKTKKRVKNPTIDKNKLTMFDLISYNPPLNDLNKKSDEDNNDINDDDDRLSNQPKEIVQSDDLEKSNEKNVQKNSSLDSEKESNDDDDSESIGPRVKINEKGEIVLDESSLIVKRKKPKDVNIKTVYEDDKTLSTRTNYSSFKKPGKSNEKKLRWTDDETVKFYTALTIIGTDFTLMSELFFRDQRTRVDLKNKFKQEERFHKILIDNALKKSDLTSIQNIENFNFDIFSSSSDSDSEENVTNSKHSEKEATARKSKKKDKSLPADKNVTT